MKTIEYTVNFLTPAFLGNAGQSGQWRTPPFKALLRQWWRVVWATQHGIPVDIGKMREKEGELFGNAGAEAKSSGRSKVLLRLDDWSEGKLSDNKWKQEGNSRKFVQRIPKKGGGSIAFDPIHYAGYGLLKNSSQMEQKRSCAISRKESGILKIAVPDSDWNDVTQAMSLIHQYGTLGGRSRNGWGSVELTTAAQDAMLHNISKFCRQWQEALELDWPQAIGQDEKGSLVWEIREGFQDENWKALMAKFGTIRKQIRSIIKAPSGSIRLPNTIRFKARRAGDNSIKGVIFHMPCKPPPGIKVQYSIQQWETVHKQLDTYQGLQRLRQSST